MASPEAERRFRDGFAEFDLQKVQVYSGEQ